MKIQHKIEINKFEIETILVDPNVIKEIYDEESGKKEDAPPPSGLFIPRTMKIFVNSDQCKQQLYATWLHEVIEAINFIYDLQLEHHQIIQLESALFSLDIKIGGIK